MGIMTDFVIADPSDAERVGESSPSEPDFEWFETKGVLEHQVAALRTAALGIPFDPKARLPESLVKALYLASEEGPAIYQVPPDLVERLAALDEDGLTAVAEGWAAASNEIKSRWCAWCGAGAGRPVPVRVRAG